MTEFEKMKSGMLYDYSDKEISDSLEHAKRLCARLQSVSIYDDCYREMIEELIPGIPKDSTVCPPFSCGYGHRITIGHNVWINFGCTMLDSGGITIGDNVLLGPNCQLYTPQHPYDYLQRRRPVETAYPITIGDDTWLGGGVVVRPGVSIGKRCIIGAGSVVVQDIPDDCMAVGNPAVVKHRIPHRPEEEE
ncbi:MAG: sugar O-acetyltransferase [Prevotellaceae bacterium]|nr:sugar O-acetyltransferase [Prevotellaceae bacterium]